MKTLALALVMAMTATAVADTPGWTLTFQDEFNGSGVDWSKWTSGYWFGQVPINSELQAYVPEANTVSDGLLHITARHQQAIYGNATMEYTSGALTTINAFAQQFGRFEMRARIPTGKGYWPAFWLLPADRSWPPEIDVMEILGQTPSTVYMTTHYNDITGQHRADGRSWTGPDFSADFHTYTVEWNASQIVWLIDDVERFRSDQSPDGPFYMLVNLAVGGNWPGSPDANTAFPQSLDVDYIRAYSATPEPTLVAPLALFAAGLLRRRS